MSEARTKLDILYQNVLGDVKEILDHMDSLKAGLPHAFEGSITSLKNQTDSLTSMAEKIDYNVSDITKKIDAYVSAAASSAGDAVRVNVRQGVSESLHNLVHESLLPILHKASTNSEESLRKLISISSDIENKITTDAGNAIGALETAIKALKEDVEKEREKIEENKWKHLQYTAIGAFLGAGASITVSTILLLFKFGH